MESSSQNLWLFRNQSAPSADQQISSKTVTKQVDQ